MIGYTLAYGHYYVNISHNSITISSNNKSMQFHLSSNFSVSSSPYEKPSEYKLRQLLKLLRISATIHQIPEWSQNEEFIQQSSVLKHFTKNSNTEEPINEENINRSKLYMQR